MLEAVDITYSYSACTEPVLANIQIKIKPGEIVGICGQSGGGKTTLAKILSGYLAPGAGRVVVDGADLPGSGRLPVQLLNQHPELSVNPRWRVARVLAEEVMPERELLTALQINMDWLDRYPHELSGGEIQRVTVARALGPETRYIIADEITTMLDAITQVQIWQVLLEAARNRNIGILTISHDRQLLNRVCDTVLRLGTKGGLQLA